MKGSMISEEGSVNVFFSRNGKNTIVKKTCSVAKGGYGVGCAK